MNGNGNTWLRTLLISVASIVLGAAIVGAASNSISNSISLAEHEIKVTDMKSDVDKNTERTESIDVMQKQVDIIEKNVGKILEKLEK